MKKTFSVARRAVVCVFLGIVIGTVACSPAPMPISASASDPSNPAAPEGLPRPVSPAPSAPKPPTPTHHHAAQPADTGATQAGGDAGTATVYVCPMHPEVTSPSPGRCPKCGMNLVPKK